MSEAPTPGINVNLKGKIVLVTGGTRGIGRALVTAFCGAGATVYFTYRAAAEAANALASDLKAEGRQVVGVQLDATDAQGAKDLCARIEAEHKRIDVLINNAGIIADGLAAQLDDQAWDQVINTNLGGAFRTARAAIPYMMRQRSGVIINISSVVAQRPGSGHANYVASKGGLEAMTRALAVELAPRKIRVNAIAPGMIETEMSERLRQLAADEIKAKIPLRRFGQADEIAQAALFLASDAAQYITGAILPVDGGLGI